MSALTVVLWVRRDATAALRCVEPLVQGVPAQIPAELLVVAHGLAPADAAPLLELQGVLTVVLVPEDACLGDVLAQRVTGRVLLVDGDTACDASPDAPQRLRDAVWTAATSDEPVTGDPRVLAFDAGLLHHPAAPLAVDQIALLGVLRIATRRHVLPQTPAPRIDPDPAPSVSRLPDAPLISVVVYGAVSAMVGALARLRERTRLPFRAILSVAGSADVLQTSPAARHSVIVDLPAPTTDIELINAALPHSEGDIVVVVPAVAALSRFWLEGLIAGLQADPRLAAVWPVDVAPAIVWRS